MILETRKHFGTALSLDLQCVRLFAASAVSPFQRRLSRVFFLRIQEEEDIDFLVAELHTAVVVGMADVVIEQIC